MFQEFHKGGTGVPEVPVVPGAEDANLVEGAGAGAGAEDANLGAEVPNLGAVVPEEPAEEVVAHTDEAGEPVDSDEDTDVEDTDDDTDEDSDEDNGTEEPTGTEEHVKTGAGAGETRETGGGVLAKAAKIVKGLLPGAPTEQPPVKVTLLLGSGEAQTVISVQTGTTVRELKEHKDFPENVLRLDKTMPDGLIKTGTGNQNRNADLSVNDAETINEDITYVVIFKPTQEEEQKQVQNGGTDLTNQTAYKNIRFGKLNNDGSELSQVEEDKNNQFSLKEWHDNMLSGTGNLYDITYVFQRINSQIKTPGVMVVLEQIIKDSLNKIKELSENLDIKNLDIENLDLIKKHKQIIDLISTGKLTKDKDHFKKLINDKTFNYNDLKIAHNLCIDFDTNEKVSVGLYNILKEVIMKQELNQNEILGQLCKLMTGDDVLKGIPEVIQRCTYVKEQIPAFTSTDEEAADEELPKLPTGEKTPNVELLNPTQNQNPVYQNTAVAQPNQKQSLNTNQLYDTIDENINTTPVYQNSEEARKAAELAAKKAADKAAEDKAAAEKAAADKATAETADGEGTGEDAKKAQQQAADKAAKAQQRQSNLNKRLNASVILTQGRRGVGPGTLKQGGAKKTKKNKASRGGSSKKRKTLKKSRK